MAIENIFREIDKILDSYNSHEAIRSQSERFITEVYYTEQWTKGVMFDIIKRKLGKINLTPSESAQIVSAARNIFGAQTSVPKWKGYLSRAGFIVLDGKLNKKGFPSDYNEDAQNQVYVSSLPGGGVKVCFYQSYTAEAGIGEPHGAAQREYLIDYAQALAEELNDRNFKHTSGLGRRGVRDYTDPESSSSFVPDSRESYRKASAYKGYRLHGNTGRFTGAGERSDTTRALIDFLDKASGREISTENSSLSDVNSIVNQLNMQLNAAYKIEGLNEIDLFKKQDISKSVVIKIIFGTAAQNTLMKHADRAGSTPSDPSIDKLLKNIRDDFMKQWGSDPNKKGSKSVAELNTLGAFAFIPKEMKTASGMPDMRFKLNKQIMKLANLVEKSKGQKGKVLKKAKKKTIKRNKVTSTVALNATGKYNPKTTASDTSLGTLMQLVNRALPRVLKRNMEPPALQYRGIGNPKQGTGPFNTGVRVTSITQHKQVAGGINVNYTYEKYPYQTFEPGFKQGDPFRDPRKLIQESIRDIMIERKQSRFLNFRRY